MPRHLTRSFGALASAVALAVLTVACSLPSTPKAGSDPTKGSHRSTGPGATGGTTNPSAPEPPAVGECRNLGYGDISVFTDDTSPVACANRHTAYTFDVKDLPEDIAFTGVQVENDAVQGFAGDSCRTSFARFIGGDSADRALSRLTVTYFVPDQRHFDLGAHWVRCDVIALKSANVLAELPRRLGGILDGKTSPARFGVCSRAEPGTTPGAALVMCSEDHSYRALAALRLGGTDAPYPGEQIAKVDGRQRCEDFVDEALGPGGGYTYTWTYPLPSDWQTGQRFGYCWLKTAD